MAYELKDTGLGAAVDYCILVDDDGETVLELKGSTLVRHANVTTGAKNWKGVSRGYFETFTSGINVYGVSTSSPRPRFKVAGANGGALFVAVAGLNPMAASGRRFLVNGGGASSARTNTGLTVMNGGVEFQYAGSSVGIGATAPPLTGNTSLSMGFNIRQRNATQPTYDGVFQPFYGLESGSISADGTIVNANFGGTSAGELFHIGGTDTYAGHSAKFHVVVGFNRMLEPSEWTALHNDWFGELIQGAGGAAPDTPVITGVTGVAGTSATLNWELSDGATSYEVAYRNVTNSGSYIALSGSPYNASTTSATKTDFAPAGHTFRMRVRAVNENGASQWAESSTFVIPGSGAGETIDVLPASATFEVGATQLFEVSRSAVAPSGGLTFNLSASPSGVVDIPASVAMPAGVASVNFLAEGASAGSTTITATNSADSGETDTASATVVAARVMKVLAHADAEGTTSVKGFVYAKSVGYHGDPIGEFSGATFASGLEAGEAVLKVPILALEGDEDAIAQIAENDELVCSWEGLAKAKAGSDFQENDPIGSTGRGSPATVILE